MKETDLAWLAGIWDGEGSIVLFSNQEKDGTKKIKPVCVVVNTDISIINEIQRILVGIECNFVIHERKPKNRKHNVCWAVSTSNMLYLKRFLDQVSPYLKGLKKSRADILSRYVNQRLLKVDKRKFNGTTPYDDKDWSFIDEFRSSETTREAA